MGQGTKIWEGYKEPESGTSVYDVGGGNESDRPCICRWVTMHWCYGSDGPQR